MAKLFDDDAQTDDRSDTPSKVRVAKEELNALAAATNKLML